MVPEGWTATQLGDCATFQSGGTPSKANPDFWDGEIPWVSAKDLKQHYILDSQDHLSELGAAQAKMAAPNSVLMLVRGMTLMKDIPIGFVKRPVAFNQDVKALVTKKGIDPLFLSYLLVGKKLIIMGLVNTANHGTGRLDTELVRSLPLDLPPLPEQQKIAEILSTWDKAIATTEALLANARTQKRALMQCLLTGARRFPGFEDQPWREVRLGEVVTGIPGGGTPEKSNAAYWGGDLPWVSVKDLKASVLMQTQDMITEVALNSSATNAFPAGTIVMATRMAVGSCAILGKRMAINQDLKAILPNERILNRYLFHCLQSSQESLSTLGTGSTVKGITLETLRGLKIGLPENEDEQAQISEAIECAADEIATLETDLDHLRTEKKSLMQQLLTGKRRVLV